MDFQRFSLSLKLLTVREMDGVMSICEVPWLEVMLLFFNRPLDSSI